MQFLLYDIKRSLDKESLEKYGDNFKMATITCLDKVCPLDCIKIILNYRWSSIGNLTRISGYIWVVSKSLLLNI